MKKSSTFASICACACILIPISTNASTIYTYTGNSYNIIDYGTLYNTSMSVSGQLELSTALAPNLVLASVLPTSFSFNDGVNTITSQSFSNHFIFSTDSSGNIIDWQINLVNLYPTPVQIGDLRPHIFTDGGIRANLDSGSIDSCSSVDLSGTCVGNRPAHQGVTYNNPGTWSVSTVPVPAAIWLFVSGLLGLVSMARRKA